MSGTGQGLLDNGQELDILVGSEIVNIWGKFWFGLVYPTAVDSFLSGKVKKAFPWYMRMHSLMGSSPIVSKAALTHSKSPIDLGLLDRGGRQVLFVLFKP
jgi:hypothetical protein